VAREPYCIPAAFYAGDAEQTPSSLDCTAWKAFKSKKSHLSL